MLKTLIHISELYLSPEGTVILIDEYDFMPRAIAEINSNGKYSYFVVCLDAEENTVAELTTEIDDFLTEHKLKLNNAELVLIFQNRCLESWLLGNCKIYSRNPQNKPLLDYTKYNDRTSERIKRYYKS